MLDCLGREKKRRGALGRNLVAEAKKRIATHGKCAPRRVLAFGAWNNEHVPIYRLVNEDYKHEHVAIDYTCYYPKPEHLKTRDNNGLHFRNSRKRAWNAALESTWKDGGQWKGNGRERRNANSKTDG